ncbi:MAG: hypothetical protein FJX77_17915, partial [Armatimonadetes bacterium]|nr:hypothetical protein [Armatimonadota bacterium]
MGVFCDGARVGTGPRRVADGIEPPMKECPGSTPARHWEGAWRESENVRGGERLAAVAGRSAHGAGGVPTAGAAGDPEGRRQTMKITDIETILIHSPGRRWTMVRVFTDEGWIGLGEATYSKKEPLVVAAIEHLKREVIGEDPARIEYLWHKLFWNSSLGGIWRMAGPVAMSAIAGIDMALWDLKGKVANLPLVELLGGQFRDRVSVYTHFYGETPEESAAAARGK